MLQAPNEGPLMKVVVACHEILLAHVLQGFAALSGQAGGQQSTAISVLVPPAMDASADMILWASRDMGSAPSDDCTGEQTEGSATTAVSTSGGDCESLLKQAVVVTGCSTLSADRILEVRAIRDGSRG